MEHSPPPIIEFKPPVTKLDKILSEPSERIPELRDALRDCKTIVVHRTLYDYVREHLPEMRVVQSFVELVWSFFGETTLKQKDDFKKQVFYMLPFEIVPKLEKLTPSPKYDQLFKDLCVQHTDAPSASRLWYPIDLFLQLTPSQYTVSEEWQLLQPQRIVERCKREISEKTAELVAEKLREIDQLLQERKEQPIETEYPQSGIKRSVAWLDEDVSEDILSIKRLTNFAFIGMRPYFIEQITEALQKAHNVMHVESLTLRDMLNHTVLCRKFAQFVSCDIRYRRCQKDKTQKDHTDNIVAEYQALLKYCFKNVYAEYNGAVMTLKYDDSQYLEQISNKTPSAKKKK